MTAGALRLKEYACPGILVSVSFWNLASSPCVMAQGLFIFKECDYVERKKRKDDRRVSL
jgi:hypothetical protein